MKNIHSGGKQPIQPFIVRHTDRSSSIRRQLDYPSSGMLLVTVGDHTPSGADQRCREAPSG